MTLHREQQGKPGRGLERAAGKGRGRRQPYAWLRASTVATEKTGVASVTARVSAAAFVMGMCVAGPQALGVAAADTTTDAGSSSVSAGPTPGVPDRAARPGSRTPRAAAGVNTSAAQGPAGSAATDSAITLTAPVEATSERRGDATAVAVPASRRATRSALSTAGSAASVVTGGHPGSVSGAAAAPARQSQAIASRALAARATGDVFVGLPTSTAVTGTAVAAPAVAVLAAAAAVQPATLPVMQALNTAITNLFDSTAMWLSDLPASPARDLISGALLLVRRTLFNQLPTAVPRRYQTTSTGQYVGTVGAVDPEGDTLIYSLAETPQYGTVQITADGTYTYTPGVDFAGTDEFTVAVTDPGFNLLQPFSSRQSLVAVGVPRACGRNSGAAASAKSIGGGCGVPKSVGLDLGTALANPAPSYTEAVRAIKMQGVTSIRMYDILPDALNEIMQTIPNANVTVAIPNYLVPQLVSDPLYAASVLTTLKPYNSIVKTILVGNEVDQFPTDLAIVATAVANMQNAIAAEHLSTAVTVSFTMGVITNSYPPSESILNPNLPGLTQLLGQLKDWVEIDPYPLIDLQSNPQYISLPYALGLPSSTPVVDNGVVYHSLFWAEYDGMRWALNKAGFTLPIYVGETGWATSSVENQSPYSNVANAKIYNQNIADSILNVGSPKFGTKDFPFYLFEFSDENQKPGGLFEQHWGWYSVGSAGELTQKYTLDL